MALYIVIREFKLNDKLLCDKLIKDGMSSNISSSFWTAATREV